MSQLDINHNSRHTSLSSIRYRNFDDDDTDQKSISATSPTSAKRYATYELNWSNPSYSDHIDRIDRLQNNDTSTNSAQVASRWSLPNPSPPPTIPLPPIPQEKLQQKQQQHNNNNNINSNNNNNNNNKSSRHSRKSLSPINTRRSELRDKNNDDEPQSPFGGITVTTVKVEEILHSPTEDHSNGNDEFKGKSKQKNSRPEPLNLTSADPVGIITSEGNKDRKDRKDRKQRINLSPPPPPPVSRPPPPLPQNHNFKNHDPKMLKQKKRSSIINSQKIIGNKNVKKPEIIIPKEMAFIDPRLLAHNKSLIRNPSTKSTTAAVTTTTTTKNRNRKILKRGGSFYRKRAPPKNLEFGSTSNPIHSNDPTDMEADLPPLKQQMFPWLPGSSKPPQLLHASLVPLPRMNRGANRDSHIITNNMIENASVKPKRNSKLISGRLSRANSQRRRTSFIAPDPNRASLVFRRQILEESLMMSFGGMMMNGVQQQPTSVTKPPIRRKTKKVSNAKIEDRETRRERRRKAKEAQNNNNVIEGENESNDIIKSQKKELYMGPQPPPRKLPQDMTITPPPQKPKNNALSLLPSPTDQKLGNCPSLESSTDDPPPFPTHLARSTLFFENNSNKERSKRKQPTYSPSIGQPASSPITPISNYSHVTPSTSEGNDLINNEESQYDIISSEETSTIHQLPSPTLTPNKSQKIGMSILGLFNKQTTKDSTTPPFSQIGSPALYPTQLPPLSSSTTPLSSTPPLSTTPPESPPLSPKSLKVPQQLLGKSRRGIENGSVSPPAVQDQEKKRKIEKKMEQFEALIASSEAPSSKKPITEKIKAITTAITTVASTATSSASSSIISNTSLEKRKKSADGTASNSPRYSSEESFKSVRNEIGLRRDSSSSRGSLANSLTDSIRYKSDERSELGPGDDGVIRVTLTPAVCR